MDFGIDFGTSYVTICTPGRGVMLREPSVIALNSETGHIVACGSEAAAMRGRAPATIRVVCPLEKGVIADYEAAEALLRYYVSKVCSYRVIKPRAVIAMPLDATEVERRSLVEAVSAAGMRRVTIIEGVLAAAVGAGMPVGEPRGNLIVNLGGGSTEAAVVSLLGVASTVSLRQGGDSLNDAIIRYVRGVHSLVIGDLQAEYLKKSIGSVLPFDGEQTCAVSGRQVLSGLPFTAVITAEELRPVVCREVDEWLNHIGHMMEQTPPDLLSDVYTDGMTLTGGGALLRGLATYAAARLNAPCRIAAQPEACVALGAAAAVQYADKMRGDVLEVSAFSYRLSDQITD